MRGVYTTHISISALTAARTLIYITAPSTRCVEVLSAEITNKSNETNEQLEACLQKVSSLGTPTATTLTPSKHEAGDQSAAATAKGNVTASEPTYAGDTEIGVSGFASLSGWCFAPVPEERPIIAAGDTWGLRMLTSTFTACDLRARITFREVG